VKHNRFMKISSDLRAFRPSDYWATVGSLLLFTFFSPTGWLLKTVLSPYLDWNDLTVSKLAPTVFVEALLSLFTQLQDLGPVILLGEILPLLILCFSVSIFYLLICQKAIQILLKTCQLVS
jgi:hypothetical protein